MSGGTWRYEVVSGQWNDGVSWVELRQYTHPSTKHSSYNVIASAATVKKLVADFREWLAVAEAYQAQGQP